jgi:hypothetical protein
MINEFTSKSTGLTVHLRPVPLRYVLEYSAKFPDPDPEKYTDPVLYGAALAAAEMARMFHVIRFLICQGIIEDPPQEWDFDFDTFGLVRADPADKIGYKVQWVETCVCPHPEDVTELVLALMALSGVGDKVVKEIGALMRAAEA